jgi:hypothetical protein
MFHKLLYYKKLVLAAVMLAVVASMMGLTFQPAAASSTGQVASSQALETLSLTIASVEKGKSVTIRVVNMPAYKEFRVRMNQIGTKGVGGTIAGTVKTGKDGSVTAKLPIPAQYKDLSLIAIRIEATDSTGYYAYNWFTNNTSGGSTSTNTGGSSSPSTTVTGSGKISIESVEEDVDVTITARYLPANRLLSVWFDWRNQKGVINSLRAGTVKSDSSGTLKATIKMSVGIHDRREVGIRLVDGSSTSAALWFLNVTSDDGTGGSSPSGSDKGIPYFVIQSVKEDDSVTIKAYNFPTKKEFVVRMGKMGTEGVDGTKVDTFKTGKDASFTATFDIPSKLWNRDQIAIRIEAADGSGYYAYNWFYNTTTP